MTKFTFRVEMKHGQDQRIVDADVMREDQGWLIFYRNPAVGGVSVEYWRARLDCVVCVETARKS